METTILPVDVAEVLASGLIAELDADLLSRYPGEPVNGVDPAEFRAAGGYFVLARRGSQAAGCGAFRPYDARRPRPNAPRAIRIYDPGGCFFTSVQF